MDEHSYPSEATYQERHGALPDRRQITPILEELKL